MDMSDKQFEAAAKEYEARTDEAEVTRCSKCPGRVECGECEGEEHGN